MKTPLESLERCEFLMRRAREGDQQAFENMDDAVTEAQTVLRANGVEPLGLEDEEAVDAIEQLYKLRYRVLSSMDGGSAEVGTGEHITPAASVDEAKRLAIEWAHAHDPRCDSRIDPIVEIISISAIPIEEAGE